MFMPEFYGPSSGPLLRGWRDLPRWLPQTPCEPLHVKDTQRLGVGGWQALTEEVLPVLDPVVIANQNARGDDARGDR